jgi:hypothetical protein
MVCAVFGLYTPYWCWYKCPKIRNRSKDWAQLSRLYLKTETESSLRNVVFCNINRTVFLDRDRTMNSVQKHNICNKSGTPQENVTCIWCRCCRSSHNILRTLNQMLIYSFCFSDAQPYLTKLCYLNSVHSKAVHLSTWTIFLISNRRCFTIPFSSFLRNINSVSLMNNAKLLADNWMLPAA